MVGKSVISVCKKAKKGEQVHFMAEKKLRKRSGFKIYSYFKDSTLPQQLISVQGSKLGMWVQFINRRWMPFQSKMVCN